MWYEIRRYTPHHPDRGYSGRENIPTVGVLCEVLLHFDSDLFCLSRTRVRRHCHAHSAITSLYGNNL